MLGREVLEVPLMTERNFFKSCNVPGPEKREKGSSPWAQTLKGPIRTALGVRVNPP